MKKSTLKFGLIGILLIFAVVPTLLLGAVGTWATLNYGRQVGENELAAVSLSKSGSLDALFTRYINAAAALAKVPAVVDTAQKNNGAASNELAAYTNGDSDILDTLIVDKSGNVLLATKADTGKFENYVDGSSLLSVSGLLTWEKYAPDNTDAFYVSRPIKDSAGTDVGYVVLVISVNADSSIGKALSKTYNEGSSHLLLVDSDGNTVNFSGTGSVMRNGQTDAAFADAVGGIFSSTENVSGTNNAESMKIDKAGRYTMAYGFLPNIATWRWVGIAPTSSLSDFADGTNIIIWAVVAVLCVLALLIAFAIIGRFVSDMQKTVKEMSNIDLDEGVTTMRFEIKHDKSELGAIKSSFNDFLDEVHLNGERYRTIAALSDNMLFEWDFHKERMYVSDNVLAKFDLDISSATLSNGRFLDSLMEQEYADKYKRDINTLLKKQGSYSAEYQLKAKSGATVWVSCKATCISDRLGEPLRVIGVLNDIDNEKKLEVQLSERASYDFLSQLYNRSTFIKKLSGELDRRGPNKIGMMFIDVDDFKFINDRYGHAVGDAVIRFVADTIRKKVDDRGGYAGRFGGDEFVLCYTNQEDVANLEQIAMDLIDELYVGYTTEDGMLINVRASIGISYCPLHTEDNNELIAFADTAMYFVKKNGKTNYHVYVPEDSASGEYKDPEFEVGK